MSKLTRAGRFAIGAALFAAALAVHASPREEVRDVVRRLVEAGNGGDWKSMSALCADDVSIVDGLPPFEWHGTGAVARWIDDYEAYAKKNAVTDLVMHLRRFRHVVIEGERAYVVARVDVGLKANGKPIEEKNAVMTVALRKEPSRWLVASWTFAAP